MTNVESIKCANLCLVTILVLTERTLQVMLNYIEQKSLEAKLNFLYDEKIKRAQIGSKQNGLKTVKKPTLVFYKFGNTSSNFKFKG